MGSRALRLTTLAVAFAVPLLATRAPEARASTSVAVSLTELASAAQTVDVVVPLDATSAWDNGRIWTVWRLRVEDHVAGAAPSSPELLVRTAGGVVDHVGQYVEGEASFTRGARTLVFLGAPREDGAARVVARAQGEYRFDGARLARMPDVGNLVPRAIAPPLRVDASPAVAALHGATLTEARAAIVRAWEASHAR